MHIHLNISVVDHKQTLKSTIKSSPKTHRWFQYLLIFEHLLVMASSTVPRTPAGRHVIKYLKKLEEESWNRKQRSKLAMPFSSFSPRAEVFDLYSHSYPYEQTNEIQGPDDQTSAQLAKRTTTSCTDIGK